MDDAMESDRLQYRVIQRERSCGEIVKQIVIIDARDDDGISDLVRNHYEAISPDHIETVVQWRTITAWDDSEQ